MPPRTGASRAPPCSPNASAVLTVPRLPILWLRPISRTSFRSPGEFGGLAPLVDEAGKSDLNVESYVRFFTEAVYAQIFVKSFVYAVATTLLCLALAYPLAALIEAGGKQPGDAAAMRPERG